MALLSSLSISYRQASVDEIERARLADPDAAIRRLVAREGISEAMVLQTCNRVELYAVSDEPEAILSFARVEGLPWETMSLHEGDACLRRLLRLACGLDSMIVGEDQVLGQLKAAYLHAEKCGTLGPTLSAVVMKAMNAGKRARQETRINKGSVSIGSAAVDLAETVLGDLRGKTILVVGAGEMGTLVANAISEKSLRAIYVANRTFEQAEKLASNLRGTAVRLERICDYIGSADVAICATGAPHLIITKKMVEECKGSGPLLIIDIANPRNVEPSADEVPGVTLFNIDGLRRISEANLEMRRQEAARVEAIIDEELVLLDRDLRRRLADQAISRLYRRTDEVRLNELSRAISRLGSAGELSEKQVRIIQEFSTALTGKILARPARKLRLAAERCDEQYLRTAQELFDLPVEEEDGLPGHKAKAAKTE
jgi:glutamyl-tRNA reductase